MEGGVIAYAVAPTVCSPTPGDLISWSKNETSLSDEAKFLT